MEDVLIRFQCFLNEKKLITNHEWDYRKAAKTFMKSEKPDKDAESVATDFCEWVQDNHFVYTTSPTDIHHKYWEHQLASMITTQNKYSTNQLYEQFMIERSRRTQKE